MPLKPALHIRPKSILFATDLAPESQNALRHAVAVARHFGATLHIANVVSSMGFRLAGPQALAYAYEVAKRDVEDLRLRLENSGTLQGSKLDTAVREGDVWQELERLIEEDEVDLVVIGTHGRRGLGRLLLGSVAERIFRCSPCPVITVGPEFLRSGVENSREPRPILFATDFQAASLQALPYLVTFAQERHVKLVAMHVIDPATLSSGTHWETADSAMERRKRAEQAATLRLRRLIDASAVPESAVEFCVRFGDPAEEIMKFGSELRVDAIGMGLHRTAHATTVTHLPQSIAHRVVCEARCAVFTARE
jgi:nucleotide-binding universal stress UspA family protein